MITEQDRIRAIENSEFTDEVRAITYKGERKPYPVKRIPLRYLLYNPHNGRIRSYTKSYESSFHTLRPETTSDNEIIEQFLFNSAISRNNKTLESLEEKGQQESGIVTRDGIIIDGNRRATLLNMLGRKNNEDAYFNAIVLPDMLRENEREIVTLETSYQMGVDSKVDYNPIEKYIRCKELNQTHGYSVEAIANIMAENSQQISEWLSILSVMDRYLDFLGTPEIYTRLEKREGHFVDLHGYIKSYSNRRPTGINWGYQHSDLDNLERMYFNYIRLGIPVVRARVIAKPASGNSFFCHREIWSDFLAECNEIISSYDEPSFAVVKENNPPEKSNEDIIRNIDETWRQEVGDSLENNLTYFEIELKEKLQQYTPVKLLKRALNTLGQIEESVLVTSDMALVKPLIATIKGKIEHFETLLP